MKGLYIISAKTKNGGERKMGNLLRGLEAEVWLKKIQSGEEKSGFGYFYIDGRYCAFKVVGAMLMKEVFDNKFEAHNFIYGDKEEE